MTTFDPHTAPRWVHIDRRVRRDERNCWWCGSFSGNIHRNGHAVAACLACGSVQCNADSRCRVCLHGWMPGWSRGIYSGPESRQCGYKGCDRDAVAEAPRVKRVCADCLDRPKMHDGRTLAVHIAQNVVEVTEHQGGYFKRWRWMAWREAA